MARRPRRAGGHRGDRPDGCSVRRRAGTHGRSAAPAVGDGVFPTVDEAVRAAADAQRRVFHRLLQRHGRGALTAWQERNEAVVRRAAQWDQALTEGTATMVYRFDHDVRHEEHVRIEGETLYIEGLPPIALLD